MPEHTIAENLSRLVTAKVDIANAITTMGGTVNTGDGFEEFPADIATIPSGGEITEFLKFSGTAPFTLKTSAGKKWNGTIEYSTDKESWSEWTGSSSTAISSSASAPYVLYLRGTNNTHISSTAIDDNDYSSFVFTTSGTISCVGDIRSLLDCIDPESTTMDSHCFYRMFQDCIQLKTPPSLPATALSEACYRGMFSGCSSLIDAPALPAMTLTHNCYGGMFEHCTSLANAPVLPSKSLAEYCYSFMFQGCTSLVSPPELPAETTAAACYMCMFKNCTSLIILPGLPSLTLSEACYGWMFEGCTSIKLATTKSGIYQNTYRVPVIGNGIEGTDSLNWMFGTTGGPFTGTPSINTTYYTPNQKKLASGQIFGVSWDGSSATTMTRTDDAASFSNPDPYVNDNNHPGSSPFDNIMPWSGMRRVTLDGNELVEIPKFWYKITKTGSTMTFQIANGPVEGFSVSPAHMDRGDGAGERDYVYVGRYHCSSTNYKSTSGSSPKVSITRSTARTNIHNLGSDYWQFDFAMFWTIRMLYIVEFADWDSQKVIGYGCGNGSSVVTMGYTDSMLYHTGTMASSRTTYAASTQYRYIEGVWDNVYDWCDGIRFSSSTIYTYLNPSTYSDSSGGTNTGTRPTSSNCINAFGVPSATDHEWALYPSSVVSDSSYSTYVADCCYYNSSGVVLYVGGYFNQERTFGMFYLNGRSSSSSSGGSIGARLMYLPS